MACGMYEREEKHIQDFMGKPKVRTPLGRPRPTWEDNSKTDLHEIGWNDM